MMKAVRENWWYSPPEGKILLTLGEVNTESIALSWSSYQDAQSYNVYRNGSLLKSGVGNTSYTDSSIVVGQTYIYVITATTVAGEVGDSNEVSATPQYIIDYDTKVNIFVDTTGGHINTSQQISEMVSNELKSVLLQYYRNEDARYDEMVKYVGFSDERFLLQLANMSGKMVNIVFNHESSSDYHTVGLGAMSENSDLRTAYVADIDVLHTNLSNQQDWYVGGVMAMGEINGDFNTFMSWVDGGLGNYSGLNGFSTEERLSTVFGVPLDAGRAYYRDLIIQFLESKNYFI